MCYGLRKIKDLALTLALSPLGRGDLEHGRVRVFTAGLLISGCKKADTREEDGAGLFSFVVIK